MELGQFPAAGKVGAREEDEEKTGGFPFGHFCVIRRFPGYDPSFYKILKVNAIEMDMTGK